MVQGVLGVCGGVWGCVGGYTGDLPLQHTLLFTPQIGPGEGRGRPSRLVKVMKVTPAPWGVVVASGPIGDSVGDLKAAGDDLSGNRGLAPLPRL